MRGGSLACRGPARPAVLYVTGDNQAHRFFMVHAGAHVIDVTHGQGDNQVLYRAYSYLEA